MNAEDIREYCLSKPGATESFPFGDTTLVFKAGQKIFALLRLDYPLSVNLKCDPEKAIQLRERYPAIKPGYHMNKKHWNTIEMENLWEDTLVKSLIDHSYDLVTTKGRSL